MSAQGVPPDEIIVVEDDRQRGRFHVIVVQLNQKHRQASDPPKEFIRSSLPLDLANDFAMSEGQRRGLPVTIWVPPASGDAQQ
jgi:hypothetical protein